MTPYHDANGVTIYHGDCLEVMRALPDASIDAVVTDPPYGLSFMGKRWDYDVPAVDVWRECLRVLKPGGHMIAFGGSRTYHRLAVNVEDAGFEIRDQVIWMYGSGFPKSLDVSKAIDKEAGAEREVVGTEKSPFRMSDPFIGNALQSTQSGDTRKTDSDGYIIRTITSPTTDAAKQWDGWGTALKPAHEPAVLARKPFLGTVAQNVQAHGTGAVNVGACRVAHDEECRVMAAQTDVASMTGNGKVQQAGRRGAVLELKPAGRWPSNLIHDGSPEVVALFPVTAPAKSGGVAGWQDTYVGGTYKPIERTGYDDNGGTAARFFYTAKASPSERGEGNFHPTVKPLALMRYLCRLVTPPGGVVLDPFAGSGTTGIGARLEGFRAVLCEREESYLPIILSRLSCEVVETVAGGAELRTKPADQLSLF